MILLYIVLVIARNLVSYYSIMLRFCTHLEWYTTTDGQKRLIYQQELSSRGTTTNPDQTVTEHNPFPTGPKPNRTKP